jgi:hypothetical protein
LAFRFSFFFAALLFADAAAADAAADTQAAACSANLLFQIQKS